MAYVRTKRGSVIETKNPEMWPEAERISKTEFLSAQFNEAYAELSKMLRPGRIIYTICTHVASSGMSRSIRLIVIDKRTARPRDISYLVAHVLRDSIDEKNGGVKVGGCGMDMGFALVNRLSYALHGYEGKGDGAKEENSGRPFDPRPGHYRAGYSLEHKWL